MMEFLRGPFLCWIIASLVDQVSPKAVGESRDCAPDEVLCMLNKLEGTLRLAGAPGGRAGRVEIMHHGEWGSVCDDHFGSTAATVVCRALGFARGLQMNSAGYRLAIRRMWLDEVRCRGDESSLIECRHRPWGTHDCYIFEQAAVECFDDVLSPAEGAVRLVAGPVRSTGRLEVYHGGQWGTVCSNDFGDTEATVVCRQLGYIGGSPKYSVLIPEGSGVIWLDEVTCTGNEQSLSECAHARWGDTNCYHRADMDLQCDAEIDGQ